MSMSRNMILAGRTAVQRRSVMGFKQQRAFSAAAADIEMLEKLLAEARSREGASAKEEVAAAANSNEPKFNIGTFNAISPNGLKKFDAGKYSTVAMQSEVRNNERTTRCFF